MGAFNINITAVGGHGCDRTTKTGEKLYGRCGKFGCPDCMAHDFVQQLRQRGNNVESAVLTHWPGQSSQVVDDLLTNTRQEGAF